MTLEYIYDHTHTSSSGTDSNASEQMFQETLSLYTNGYIIHPNIVDLNLGVTGGLNQQRFESDDESASSNGTVYGWDISATFFRTQPGNLTLYSRRTQTTQDVPFGPHTEDNDHRDWSPAVLCQRGNRPPSSTRITRRTNSQP